MLESMSFGIIDITDLQSIEELLINHPPANII